MKKYYVLATMAGILLASALLGAGTTVQSWSSSAPYSLPWIVPNSSFIESNVLTSSGDSAELTVTFADGGTLGYDIAVVSESPLMYSIRLTGDLRGMLGSLQFPVKRELKLKFNKDGTITGYGRAVGPNFDVPAVIKGVFCASDATIPLPAEVTASIEIEDFDHKTGHWSGQASRTVAAGRKAVPFPAPGQAFHGLLHGIVRIDGDPITFNGSVMLLGTESGSNQSEGVMHAQRPAVKAVEK